VRRTNRHRVDRPAPTTRLVVDPVACGGIGICAHLAPGVVALDSWGFPVLPPDPLDGADLRAARNAVAGCPRRALFLSV
jgi:ferredoxin